MEGGTIAQTKDLIVTSGINPSGLKAFIRIGDPTPSTHLTGSSIEFLQDLSTTSSCFDSAGTTSAFRIRHDTIGGYLVFLGRSGSNGPYQLMTLNDDTNTVTFGGTVTFEDIIFDLITGSHLYIEGISRFDGNFILTGSKMMIFTGSTGTASIWYDSTTNKLKMDGGGGNSWVSQYRLTGSYLNTNIYPILTSSATQIILNFSNLSVYLNGDMLIQSKSGISDWDYKSGSLTTIQFKYNIPYTSGLYLTYVYNGGS